MVIRVRFHVPSTRAWVVVATVAALAFASLGGWWLALRPWEATPIKVGAVFPLSGNAAGLAGQEALGVQVARDLVNAEGGVDGRPIELEVHDLERAQDAPAVMATLRRDGVQVVIGAYSSELSIAASSAASAEGLVYWEAGAVADQLTGRGLPLVFRVGASGANLGQNSAAFAASALAPRIGKPLTQLRVAIVNARDAYATSVADAAAATATQLSVPVVLRASYDLTLPDWTGLMASLAAARPDVIILASHIPDGVDFRRAMLAAGLHVAALIGSTMAECDPDFAGELGPDAIGIFASDRPTGGFQPSALSAQARAVYDRLAAAWSAAAPSPAGAATASPAGDWGYGSPGSGYGSSSYGSSGGGYTISGPVEEGSASSGPPEEAISGFTAAWALFRDVMPAAAVAGALNATGIATAARGVDLPVGSLPNGAGLRFSSDPATLGQNERAAAVIWQWQAVRAYTFVWPATYSTGTIGFVPLAR